MRCAACSTVWLAHPDPVLPEPPVEIMAMPDGPDTVPAAAPDIAIDGDMRPPPPADPVARPAPVESIEAAAARRFGRIGGKGKGATDAAGKGGKVAKAANARRGAVGVVVSPGAWVMAAVVVLVAGAVLLRNDVVRAAPGLASLYETAGLPVNVRGIVFEAVTTTHEIEGGQPVLIVEGRLRNVTAETQPAARLRLALLSPTGNEMRSFAMAPPRSILGPREVVTFRNRIPNPPREAEQVAVRFITVRDTRLTETSR